VNRLEISLDIISLKNFHVSCVVMCDINLPQKRCCVTVNAVNSKKRPGSSVGIATGYGQDGPGIGKKTRRGQDFSHTFRPVMGHSQPPVRWVPGLSRW
jgi:hypothetical protein